ncbi:MAG: CDP-diacylglycerol--serine O-phosphatidyltransferase [Gammaproteobacteria bacterium]
MNDDIDAIEEHKPRRAIYWLPNTLTTAALFASFYAIVAAMNGRFQAAAIAVFIAMIMDNLDSRVAHLTHTESEFGAQYDSLADMVSFGVAPALIMYEWALGAMAQFGKIPGKLGWLAAFIYATAAALRLARFNVQLGSTDKRYFIGLSSPAAAAIVVGMVWVGYDSGVKGQDWAWFAFALTLIAGVLMVSNILYFSFKKRSGHQTPHIALIALLIIPIVFMVLDFDPAKFLFTAALLYGASARCSACGGAICACADAI